jgi:HD superfamily phosphohydrolase
MSINQKKFEKSELMRKWEYKTFKDNVHGYIKMPMPFVKKLIDTELFQRLRYIEQTGMRTLYPSARHDRFIHSLGTYYLGAKAYSAFHENVKRRYSSESKSKRNHYLVAGSKGKNEIWWEKFGVLFTIACLLHDCGHAPFSHTLEYIYDMKIMGPDNDVLNLNENLVKQYTSSSFSADFGKGTGSEHERMSALLVKTEYGDAIKEIINDEFDSPIKCSEEDIEFIARSIIGCVYKDTTSKENQIKNCFIQLLNSKSIDVDKLDYIVRDAILSGLDNTSIDIDRLLESLTIIETTQVTQCPLDKYEFDTVVLEGDITGNIDANIKGVVFANNFNGTINGQVCISGSAQIVNDVKFKDGYVKINGTEHRNASIILHNASIDINAEFCDDIELKDAKFKSTEQMNARITTKEEAQIHMSSVYLKGSVTGMFTGKVLGFFDKAKAEVKIEPAFHKSSLSVIQNVITARNYEYLWIYAHHKVAYYANYLLIFVLKQSIQYLLKESESADEGLKRILSMDKKTNWNQRVFYRTNDSDIIALFKECYLRNNMSESKDAKLDTL